MRLRPVRLLRLLFSVLSALAVVVPAHAENSVNSVRLEKDAVDARVEPAKLRFELADADRITVRVWDPDGGLVKTLVEDEPREAGEHEVVWKGDDWEGEALPDEAYTFTIETASGMVYDPTTFSGGVVGDIRSAEFDRSSGTLTYALPRPARVLIRLGVRSGPMHRTLVDWKPRVGGSITEYWNGRDASGVVELRGRDDFSSLITYSELPDATVILFGNREMSYREYKLGRGKDRQKRPARPWSGPQEGLRPEGLVPAAWARAPQVRLSIQGKEGSPSEPPVLRGAASVRVEVSDPIDRDALASDQFEIIFYVDDVFFAEAERGYLPFVWNWELGRLPPGEHVLTVNVSSFRGQVGVASTKVIIAD